MRTNRLVAAVAVLVLSTALVVVIVSRVRHEDDPQPPLRDQRPGAQADRTAAPIVDGTLLATVSDEARPPTPAQWAGGPGPIPSASWWSSAVAGPGATSLWPQPLALTISRDGQVAVGAPVPVTSPDGVTEAPLEPAVTLDLGRPAQTRVVGHGPLHVIIRVEVEGGPALELTLVQGNPVVEIGVTGAVTLRVPGLASATERPGPVLHLDTMRGPWLAAPTDGLALHVGDDSLTTDPGAHGRLALGPEPAAADPGYDALVRTVATHPLEATAEHLEVDDDGTTTQTLTQTRAGGVPSPWALQPHHQQLASDIGLTLGAVPSAKGELPVIAGSGLRLVYPAVPLLWSAVPLPDAPEPGDDETPAGGDPSGSYFGGKAVYAHAARADLLRAAGQDTPAAEADAAATALLEALPDPFVAPWVRWDPRWGSAIIEPAEFGSGTELNDHSLQYGYWVAAASHLAEGGSDLARDHQGLIDLLVADYAGAALVPDAPTSLPQERTWSPYEGHSWASGTAPFSSGNNLESISESTFAWWAAARWFLSTGRASVAEAFVARFTIESALTGGEWLPQGRALPADEDVRPWSGVVWSGKSDPMTWFDPADESALGIRLLPLGPASLARYGSAESVAAAEVRWRWCARVGHDCTQRWANLLDSDAAVAGRPRLTGPDPEPRTSPETASWWRDLWTRTTLVEGWSCSVGAVARRKGDGTVIVLASNPSPEAVTLACQDGSGATRWSGPVDRTAVGEADPGS